MDPHVSGFCINLDRSPDRLAFMQDQFDRLGLGWIARHAALDAAHLPLPLPSACTLLPGEYACFLSHLRVLERAPADGYTLVIEDDMELSDLLPEILTQLDRLPLAGQDLLFLECQPHYTLAHVSTLWETASRCLVEPDPHGGPRRSLGLSLLDARPLFRWGTAAYVVTPWGRDRIVARMRAWLAEGPVLPVDRCIERALALQELTGVIAMPFLATTGLQWHRKSTIGNGLRAPSDALIVLRRLLYAGGLGEVEALTRNLPSKPPDATLRMLGLVLTEIAGVQRDFMRSEGVAGRGGTPP